MSAFLGLEMVPPHLPGGSGAFPGAYGKHKNLPGGTWESCHPEIGGTTGHAGEGERGTRAALQRREGRRDTAWQRVATTANNKKRDIGARPHSRWECEMVQRVRKTVKHRITVSSSNATSWCTPKRIKTHVHAKMSA